MKPFNLEAFKSGAVAMTRDGREAHYIGVDPKLGELSLVFSLGGLVCQCDLTGRFHKLSECGDDLVAMKTTKVTKWVNFYQRNDEYGALYSGSNTYSTEEEAEISRNRCPIYIGAFPVEIEM